MASINLNRTLEPCRHREVSEFPRGPSLGPTSFASVPILFCASSEKTDMAECASQVSVTKPQETMAERSKYLRFRSLPFRRQLLVLNGLYWNTMIFHRPLFSAFFNSISIPGVVFKMQISLHLVSGMLPWTTSPQSRVVRPFTGPLWKTIRTR